LLCTIVASDARESSSIYASLKVKKSAESRIRLARRTPACYAAS
jgi:hypothetical protein